MADKTATVTFAEYPDKAFHLRLSPVAFDDYLDIDKRVLGLKTDEDVVELIERFATVALAGWDGYDEEPTAANLRQRDYSLILGLIRQWIVAVRQVPLPLPVAPVAGGRSKGRRASTSQRS